MHPHLVRHQGRAVALTFRLPAWMPLGVVGVKPMSLRLSPAGFFEVVGRVDGTTQEDLHLTIDLTQPALWAQALKARQRPPIILAGDADFARDMGWMLDHLQWDVANDIERRLGPWAATLWQGVAARWGRKAVDRGLGR
jgi:ubiquinone biosynthesis protein UbiJ